jgi:hypothetical protein
MGSGTVVAVVRHHRNYSFRADLSGQPDAPKFAGVYARTPVDIKPLNEFNAVSMPVNVGEIGHEDWTTLTFDFGADPIPFSATDAYIQVVFRGRLGIENGGIAIGSVDLAEPTFITFCNNFDYVGVYGSDGKFVRADPTRPNIDIEPPDQVIRDFTLRHYVEGEEAPALATLDKLTLGVFARIAILTDAPRFEYRVDHRYQNSVPGEFYSLALDIPTARMQINESDTWELSPDYVTLRKSSDVDWIYQPSPDGSTIYWVNPYLCVSNFDDCVAEDDEVGEQVRRYPAFAQPNPIPMKIDFNERG